MSDQNPDREKLAEVIIEYMPGTDGGPDSRTISDAILASDWLAEHDERVRREAAAEQREKDAQIAEDSFRSGFGASGAWIAAAIREQGTSARS